MNELLPLFLSSWKAVLLKAVQKGALSPTAAQPPPWVAGPTSLQHVCSESMTKIGHLFSIEVKNRAAADSKLSQ